MIRPIYLLIFFGFTFLLVFSTINFYSITLKIRSLRVNLLMAAVILGTTLVFFTELLSKIRQFRYSFLSFLWLFFFLIALTLNIYIFLKKPNRYKNILKRIVTTLTIRYSRFQFLLIVLLSFLFIILFTAAYIYPPTNGDSMVYHLPRAMHWIQNASVAPYPTNISRQFQMQPMTEYVYANIFMLTGQDQMINLVQFFSLVGCAIAVSYIAKKLGASFEIQLMSIAFCVSIPMAVMQSVNCQNGLVLSFWITSFTALAMELVDQRQYWILYIFSGAALGLTLLTKATGFIYAFPVCLWVAYRLVIGPKRHIFLGLLIPVIALLINLPFFVRNAQILGSFLGETDYYHNSEFTPRTLFLNAIRNTAVNFTFNTYPDKRPNGILVFLKQVYSVSGASPIDEGTTLEKYDVFQGLELFKSFDEDFAGNPLHLIFCVFCIFVLPFYKDSRIQIEYLVILLMCILFFNIYLRYQIWSSRLQLPLFILFSPIIFLTLSRIWSHFARFIVVFLLVLAFVWASANIIHPFNFSRMKSAIEYRSLQYFIFRSPETIQTFSSISKAISDSSCYDVGLDYESDKWEYPWWVLLKESGWSGRIEHIRVRNESKVLQDHSFKPCAIIMDNQNRITKYDPYLIVHGEPFFLVLTSTPHFIGN